MAARDMEVRPVAIECNMCDATEDLVEVEIGWLIENMDTDQRLCPVHLKYSQGRATEPESVIGWVRVVNN
jgi:hypothetical protein